MVNHIVHLEDDHHLFNIFRVAFQAVNPNLKIVQFTEGEPLLQYVLQAGSPIDVVILDIRIPGELNGIQIAQQIRRIQYPVNIVITSAYSAPERRILTELDAIFIPKPWNIPAMIRQLLDLEVGAKKGTSKNRRETTQPPPPEQTSAPFILQEKTIQRMNHILGLVKTVLGVDASAVMIGNGENGEIQNTVVLPASWNMGKTRLFMQSFAAQIIQKQNPLFVEDVRPYVNHTTNLQNIVSYAGIPFELSDTRYRAVLCVLGTSERKWNNTDYDILCKVADLLQDTLETDNFVNLLVVRNDALHSYSSTIAHDLKAPLGAIIGYSDVVKLLMGSNIPPNVERYLTSITDSANIMSDMITRLLWLAKLDHPMAMVSEVEITGIVSSALARLQYQIDRRGIKVLLPKAFPTVIGHDAWIEEVFANLISNAIKYMGDDNPNPTIELRSATNGKMAKFEIHDNGIGISPSDQAKLFQSFSRLNKESVEGLAWD